MSGTVVVRNGRAVLTPDQALRLAGELGGGAFERDGLCVVVEDLLAETVVMIDGFGGAERVASFDVLLASRWRSLAAPVGSTEPALRDALESDRAPRG